jgi:hypothetical protein
MKDVKTMTPEELWAECDNQALFEPVDEMDRALMAELLARLRSEIAARNFGDSRKSSAMKYIRDFANRLLAAMDAARKDKS